MHSPAPFDADIAGQIPLSRVDAGAAVTATAEDAAPFQPLWQARVRTLPIAHADDPETIVIHC